MLSCGGGTGGQTAVRLLREAGIPARIVVTDSDAMSYARHLADVYVTVPTPTDAVDYEQALLRVIDDEGVSAAISCYSGELPAYAALARELDSRGVRRPDVPHAAMEILQDKHLLYQVLSNAGLPIPAFSTPDPVDRGISSDACIVKLRDSAGSRGMFLLASGEELPEAVVRAPSAYVVQEVASGEEVSLDGVVLSDGRIGGPLARRRLRVRGGLAIVGESLDLGGAADEAFGAIVALLKVTGPLNVQGFFEGGELTGITDVNARFPAGGMALTAALGLNIPAAVASDLLFGPESVQLSSIHHRRLRHYRYYEDAMIPLDPT